MSRGNGVANELEARVGDKWCPGVRDQGNNPATCKVGQDARALGIGIMLMIGAQRPIDGEMREKCAAVARILAIHDIGARESRQRAERDVAKITDRCCDEIEAGRERLRKPPL
jgi:hypothetical protein